MREVDYIIVGCGLAGIAFSHILAQNNKSFVIVDNASQKSSTVAGGLYNPVVLKRFTSVWKSKEQLDIALPFYRSLEEKLNTKLDFNVPVYRLFNSIEEQNNWFQASDNPKLSEFLDATIIQLQNNAINAKFGFGKVLQTGRIDTSKLVETYKDYLKKENKFIEESFAYSDVGQNSEGISYKQINAKYIVFCEGFGLKQNPFFKILPLNGTKGELITIKAPDLNIDFVLKSSVFLIPLGNHIYRVGSTYEWEDKSQSITQKGREELLNKLKTVINCDFEVINQVAGIRPTVIDRRPLVGQHTLHKNMYVLNGLGTRGVMIAPYVAKQLFNFIENGQALDQELSINRFV